MRWTLPGVLALMLVAGCSGQTPQAPPSRSAVPPAPAAECTSDGVAFSLGGGDSAMGVRVLNIEIVNCGSGPVTVHGYPRLRLFGEDDAPLAVTVMHGSTAVATATFLRGPVVPMSRRWPEAQVQPGTRASGRLASERLDHR